MKKLVALAMVLSFAFLASTAVISGTKEAVKAPDFKAMDLVSNKEISLKDFEGYVLLVDFWATWCAPCKKEIPFFIEFHKKYKEKKFAMIGISVDSGDEVVKKFIASNKINYPIIMKNTGLIKAYGDAMGEPIQGIPTTFTINRKGEIVDVDVGFKEKEAFEKQIAPLLKEPYPKKEASGSKS